MALVSVIYHKYAKSQMVNNELIMPYMLYLNYTPLFYIIQVFIDVTKEA